MKNTNNKKGIPNFRATFNFNNVGQGLFYSGKIEQNEKINFVYDCGSDSVKEILNKAINDFKNTNGNDIDFIVLSHLHSDHTNGLNKLLEDNNKETVVFLPYYDQPARLLIAYLTENKQEEWWYEFISNPVDYLISKKNISKIVFITNESTTDFNEIRLLNIDTSDDEKTAAFIRDKENWGRFIDNGEVIVKKQGFVGYLDELWKFKFYTHVRDDEKFLKEINRHIDSDNILAVIRDQEKIKVIADNCYNEIYKSKSYLNQTSLMMYHAPVFYDGYIRLKCSEFNYGIAQSGKINGQLLTGDISFAVNWKKIAQHFKNEFDNISIVQIPHHGSINNWYSSKSIKIKALDDIEALHWINSSAKKKHYPDKILVELFKRYQRSLHCCSEDNRIQIEFNYPNHLKELKLERILLIENKRMVNCDICINNC